MSFAKKFKLKKVLLLLFILYGIGILHAHTSSCEEFIHKKFVVVDDVREELSKAYIREHYGIAVDTPQIIPKIIVVHWTALDSFEACFNVFNKSRLSSNRTDISKGGSLNVCAHFLVDQDGTVYQLLPSLYFARHVIGLNYYAIGIENVGGFKKKLTDNQLQSNEKLIRFLIAEYPTVEYVIGHYEYREFEGTPLFIEKDPTYRNVKVDPGKGFMKSLRKELYDLYKASRLKPLKSLNK